MTGSSLERPDEGAERMRPEARHDSQAREELVELYMAVVNDVAARYAPGGGPSFATLVEEGRTALMRAVECFDPRDDSFASRAEWWIECAIRAAWARKYGPEESTDAADAAGVEIRRIERCGKAGCRCSTYLPARGLTVEGLLTKVLRDFAPLRTKLARAGRGGDAALVHYESLFWRRLIAATSGRGRVGLINGKCPWGYARATFLSGWKNVRTGRWVTGRRRDVRPERRGVRTAERGGPHRQRPRVLEVPMAPDDLRRAYETSLQAEPTRDGVLDDDPEREQALRKILLRLPRVSREAIEDEERRQKLDDPPPKTSTERGRHRRAQKRVCILILESPALEEYHPLARRVLDEMEDSEPPSPGS